ncbi:hypothetical protein ZIOFF_007413 [Zingiber officinale]|uniref:Homeobox domain-containing protein n=2 Tax=Zingiber officinale TaxID=94328 RepID=A0A8J5HQB4_ZINOF|nr:hypothetical protein ZIOFF_007413 [Zingiber officinale]
MTKYAEFFDMGVRIAARFHSHCPQTARISGAFQLDTRTQEHFLQLERMQSQLLSSEAQLLRSIDPVDLQAEEDCVMEKRRLMNCQDDKENDLHGLACSRSQGLSLTLGSHLPSNTFGAYRYEQVKNHESCTTYEAMREDLKEFDRARSHRSPAVDYIFSKGETCGSSTYRNLTSMTSLLQRSKFLYPAQELLSEVVSLRSAVDPSYDEELRKVKSFGVANRNGGVCCSSADNPDTDVRVLKLVALLDELEGRYQQYFHRMEQVISCFEMFAGSGAAASYTALTIQAMSRHFSNLRDTIITQIHASGVLQEHDQPREAQRHPFMHTLADESFRQNREALQKLGIIQNQQVWRPLRGLPEDSVAVLRTWLFENFLHPYPDDKEKLILAAKTGLTKNQISNWFINARVRIWKPMIEEMYKEEFAEHSGNLSPS